MLEVLCAAGLLSGCLQGKGLLDRDEGDAGLPPPQFTGDAAKPDEEYELPEQDPHAVEGVDPNHGSFAGGQLALVRGAGFSSDARLWFGDVEVPPASITPVDARRLQVTVPASPPGAVDVTVQNGDDASTRRTLRQGYTFDSFYVAPSSGPTSGGTVVTLYGQNSAWTEETSVTVDLEPCEVVARRGIGSEFQEVDCRTPQGTPGAKTVRAVTGDAIQTVSDAFVYGNSEDGYRGGLSGQPLDGELRVLALSDATGTAIPGATVILGDAARGTESFVAGGDGVAVIEQDGLGPERTVTIAARCFHPTTFVDVPVDRVTAYLQPVVSPACTPEGDPPLTGGSPGSSSIITGEIVFPGAIEFQRAPWNGVPIPSLDTQKLVAYVFQLSRDPRRAFSLPSENLAITPEVDGLRGYEFRLPSGLGNLTLYALAGVEDRSVDPPRFTAYVMGIVNGVLGEPGETSDEIFVSMDIPLDHAFTVTVDGPTPTSRGPDRIAASVAARFGTLGYVIVPAGTRQTLLPAVGPLTFVGLPAFTGAFESGRLVVSASAVTGQGGTNPRSVVGLFSPPVEATSVHLDGFLEVPRFEYPATNGAWSGVELGIGAEPGGPSADLTLVDVDVSATDVRWRIVAPGDPPSIPLPNPADHPDMGVVAGPVRLDVSRSRIRDFTYGTLGYADLAERSWDAHATDTLQAHYE